MRLATIALVGLGLLCARSASGQTERSIGHVTAVYGNAEIESSGHVRGAQVFSALSSDERVITKDAGLSLLLKSRIVVKLDAATSARFSEGTGQTNVMLDSGTVQVFAGKRPAYMGDAAVQDALARIDGKDAVFLASYDRAARSGYYACEHGTVNIELGADHKRITLNTDQQAIAVEGKPLEISAIDRALYNRHQRTLGRLVQSVIEQGSQTQRSRSGALDTRNALAQLEAAGYIDRRTLAVVRPLSQSTNNSENAKTTDNQVASSGGGSNSSPQPQASTPVEPSAEAPPPREAPPSVIPQIDFDRGSDKPAKQEKSNNALPKIKLPSIEKVDGDGKHDLKIPKLEKPKRSDDSDVKDLREVTRRTREQVEKSDKRGNRGHDDD